MKNDLSKTQTPITNTTKLGMIRSMSEEMRLVENIVYGIIKVIFIIGLGFSLVIVLPYFVVKGFYLWLYGSDEVKQMAAAMQKKKYSSLISIVIVDMLNSGMEDALNELEQNPNPFADESESEVINRLLSSCRESQQYGGLAYPPNNNDGELRYYSFMDDFMFFVEDSYETHPDKYKV